MVYLTTSNTHYARTAPVCIIMNFITRPRLCLFLLFSQIPLLISPLLRNYAQIVGLLPCPLMQDPTALTDPASRGNSSKASRTNRISRIHRTISRLLSVFGLACCPFSRVEGGEDEYCICGGSLVGLSREGGRGGEEKRGRGKEGERKRGGEEKRGRGKEGERKRGERKRRGEEKRGRGKEGERKRGGEEKRGGTGCRARKGEERGVGETYGCGLIVVWLHGCLRGGAVAG